MALHDPYKGPSDPVNSPCVRNCCLDDSDVCLGCGRTLEEIRAWSGMSESERKVLCERAAQRRRQRQWFASEREQDGQ